VARFRNTTPGRLRLLRASIVALALVLAVLGAVTATLAVNGTHATTRSAEPLLVNAETIYSSLADADTTAAQAFLSGGLEPPAQTQRYLDDLNRVGAQLAQAAGRTGPTGAAADALRTLDTQLPVYAGLIESARANNRQGLPVGAAYLGRASQLLRRTMLPAADNLLSIEQHQLATDYRSARADRWLIVTAACALLLMISLIVTQLFLTRRTNRLLNPLLLVATVVLLVLAVGTAAVAAAQHHRLAAAERTGSGPVIDAARARITALIEHGDDSLTLLSRDTSAGYAKDFAAASSTLLGSAGHPGLVAADTAARQRELDYLAIHAKVQALNDGGNYNAAVALETSTRPGGAAAAFAALDTTLDQTVTADQANFSRAAVHADVGVTLLRILIPLLAVAVAVLSVFGLRARIEEYR
jgi:hypothetical protein